MDDEPDLFELGRENMMVHGFNVFYAEDAMQASAIMEHEHIDILISDVIMLGVDGYQLAAIVKEKYPDIKIKLVSRYTDRPSYRYCFREPTAKYAGQTYWLTSFIEKNT